MQGRMEMGPARWLERVLTGTCPLEASSPCLPVAAAQLAVTDQGFQSSEGGLMHMNSGEGVGLGCRHCCTETLQSVTTQNCKQSSQP